MAKDKKKLTEAELEPGFFSDYGYGNGTAITFVDEPPKNRKKSNNANKSKPAKNKRK